MSRTALHGSAFSLLYFHKAKNLGMVETKLPKFEWGTVCEQNVGHTQNEWGIKKEVKPQNIIIAYTVVWDKNKHA